MSTNYTILLPPSEGKASGGLTSDDGPLSSATSFANLIDARREAIAALHEALDLPRAEQRKLFGVKTDALDAAIDANAKLANFGGEDAPLLPAIERYTGVLFTYLDYPSLDPKTQQIFDEHAVIFSGLWGLLRPTDLIPDYKLKIDATLPALGKVSAFWKPYISETLNELLNDHVVWDLLPGAHRRAWNGQALMAAHWRVKFVERKGGKLRTVSHWSKALKGALIGFLCENEIVDAQALVEFSHPEGYVFERGESEIGTRGGELMFMKTVL